MANRMRHVQFRSMSIFVCVFSVRFQISNTFWKNRMSEELLKRFSYGPTFGIEINKSVCLFTRIYVDSIRQIRRIGGIIFSSALFSLQNLYIFAYFSHFELNERFRKYRVFLFWHQTNHKVKITFICSDYQKLYSKSSNRLPASLKLKLNHLQLSTDNDNKMVNLRHFEAEWAASDWTVTC